MDLIGKTLGPYEIVEEIGVDGMAAVYRAKQAALNRQVAVKVMASDLMRDPAFRERFVREARAVAQLAHPNILPVYSFGEEAETGLLYFAMQWVDGGPLGRLLGQPLEVEAAVRIATQVARALDYAHKRGLVHRDVKPSNIFLTSDGHPLLAGFGIARIAEETRLAQAGTPPLGNGTPWPDGDYMSPEQAQAGAVDHRADIYALGVVAYEMLSGQLPFQADTPVGPVHQRTFTPPAPLCTLRPDLPKALEQAVMRALAQEPGQRYASAAEFADTLEAARAGRWRLPWPRPAQRPAGPPRAPATVRVPRAQTSSPPPLPAPMPSPSRPAPRVGVTVLGWGKCLLHTVLILVAVVILVAVALSILVVIAAGMLTEQTIVRQDWRLDEVAIDGVPYYYRRVDFERGLAVAVEPYAVGRLTNVQVDFEPPDEIVFSAQLRGSDVALQVRVREQAGVPHVQIERFNDVPLFVLGGFFSDRINSGFAQVWEDAPIRIERMEVREDYLTAVYEYKSGVGSKE
ncbi:MAG: serine/threonine protein kinase [Thermoflexales bacterium]|nr:serine/threonine protein kinase [Thermoflexales bacterium]